MNAPLGVKLVIVEPAVTRLDSVHEIALATFVRIHPNPDSLEGVLVNELDGSERTARVVRAREKSTLIHNVTPVERGNLRQSSCR